MAASYQVYKNLHTGTWSLRHRGKVTAHPLKLVAFNVRLHIGESTRLKAVAKGQRSVHAWAVAERVGCTEVAGLPIPREPADGALRYDWQQANGYIDADTGEQLPDTMRALQFFADGTVHYWTH